MSLYATYVLLSSPSCIPFHAFLHSVQARSVSWCYGPMDKPFPCSQRATHYKGRSDKRYYEDDSKTNNYCQLLLIRNVKLMCNLISSRVNAECQRWQQFVARNFQSACRYYWSTIHSLLRPLLWVANIPCK